MQTELKAHLNFINGEFTTSVAGKRLQKTDPISGAVSCELADSDLMDVVRCVQSANTAVTSWLKSTSEARVDFLEKMAQAIELHANDIAVAVYEDIGTLMERTLKYSVPEAAAHFRAHARYLIGSNEASHPTGLVGLITPASDPLVCLASRVAPALAVGNAVIAKVSRFTPATGGLFARLTSEAGLPAGLFSLLQGRGEGVGESVVRHPGISSISFMGSTETGRVVAVTAAESFKKIHLSLGAKNPVLLFKGIDLERVIPSIARLCLGQLPSQSLKGSKLLIQETIFKEALELLRVEFETAALVPVAKPQQAKIFRDAIQLALKENGKVITGGQPADVLTNLVKPHLFADLTNCSTLQQDEIAGPLVLASSFKYQHEALKYANVSPFGRAGYIFEADPDKAFRAAQKLETGSVFINTSEPSYDPMTEIPLLKRSGFASEGGYMLAKFFSRNSKIYNSAI
jgi:acyl-CoA reductase-like NAD-dependent aldehyde dehydrogenase